MRTRFKFGFLIFLLTTSTLFGQTTAKSDRKYKKFINHKLRFEMNYPEGILRLLPWSDSIYKDTFVSDGTGIKIIINTDINHQETALTELFQEALNSYKGTQITYKTFKNNFFVISGISGKHIFYLKEIILSDGGNKNLLKFDMIFPENEKEVADPILKACANSLKPSKQRTSKSNPCSDFTDKEWYEMAGGQSTLPLEETSIFASRFNWGTKEVNIFKDFFLNQVGRPIFGGNGYHALQDRIENAKTEPEREEAKKQLEERDQTIEKEYEESFDKEMLLVKPLRTMLKGRDADFLEWINEDSVITNRELRLDHLNQSNADTVGSVFSTARYFNEEQVVAQVLKDVRNTRQFQIFEKVKIDLLKDRGKIDEYLDLWRKAIRTKIFLIYKATHTTGLTPSPVGATPEELVALKKELMAFTHQMDLLQ